jgi:hypothetical protein
VEDGSLRWLPTEVCRHPFDPFIYHGRSVNARLTLIGRARRSIGRIRRAGGLGGRPAPQTTLAGHGGFVYTSRDFLQYVPLRVSLTIVSQFRALNTGVLLLSLCPPTCSNLNHISLHWTTFEAKAHLIKIPQDPT